jgi:uncharacterized protein YuzE
MKIIYDPAVDVLNILLGDASVAKSDHHNPGVILGYDEAGNVVAIGILDASRRIEKPPAG